MLGVIMGVVFTGLAVFSDDRGYDESYVITFVAYLIVAAIVFATVTGLLVGMLNGAVLALMTRAGAFRSAAGLSANRVTLVAVRSWRYLCSAWWAGAEHLDGIGPVSACS
jgi:hypothetical protein